MGASELVRSHGQGRVVDRLREHQVRALVERARRRSLVGVDEGVRGRAGVGEGRGPEGLLGGQRTLFGDQRLDGEAALPRGGKHLLRESEAAGRSRRAQPLRAASLSQELEWGWGGRLREG